MISVHLLVGGPIIIGRIRIGSHFHPLEIQSFLGWSWEHYICHQCHQRLSAIFYDAMWLVYYVRHPIFLIKHQISVQFRKGYKGKQISIFFFMENRIWKAKQRGKNYVVNNNKDNKTYQKVERELEFLQNVHKLSFMRRSSPHGEETFSVVLLLALFRPRTKTINYLRVT